nr:response regulator [uncultured Methanoregula sp.]
MTEAPPRIFIVEDEAIVASDIKETLISLGYRVEGIAKTGESAVEKVSELLPDLVLMDIHLAGKMDGIEASGRIHEEQNIPVIFLTAYADRALLDRAKKTEPYGYIIKPYDERGIQSAIEMALYKHRMEQRLRESEETTRAMVNATRDYLYLIGTDGRFLMANEALSEVAGTTPDELQKTSAYDLVGKNILTPKMACWQLNPMGEKRLVFEEQLNRSWYDVTIYPVYDKKGGVEKYAVSVRNITARKQAEDQVRSNAEYFRAIIEEASEIVVLLDQNGSFSQQSPSFNAALGYRVDDEPKKSFFDYLVMSDWQEAKQVFSEVLIHPGMAKPVRLKFETSDRSICTIRGILSNLSDNPFVGKVVLNGWVE